MSKIKLKEYVKNTLLHIYKLLEDEKIPTYEREFYQGRMYELKIIEELCEKRKRF